MVIFNISIHLLFIIEDIYDYSKKKSSYQAAAAFNSLIFVLFQYDQPDNLNY